MTVEPLVELSRATKRFPGPPAVTALHDVSLRIDAGRSLAIVGRSGSGKSTLLNIIGLLDVVSTGQHRAFGRDVAHLRRREADRFRREQIGFVFQAFHVIAHKTVRENLDLKLALLGWPRASRAERIDVALDRVGLMEREESLGKFLSGGEKQRLALARAFIGHPRLVLADEPTGNLDRTSADEVVELLFGGAGTDGRSLVLITHDSGIARNADDVVVLDAGRVR